MIKDLLDNRCSVRSFLNRDISKDIIDSIIEAGRLSPSEFMNNKSSDDFLN